MLELSDNCYVMLKRDVIGCYSYVLSDLIYNFLSEELSTAYQHKANMNITIAPGVPEWLALDVLLLRLVMDNCVDNARF